MNVELVEPRYLGYKVYYEKSWKQVSYFKMEGEWQVSPFVWFGIFNKDFSKLAIL